MEPMTEEQIANLIRCPKRVSEPPKRERRTVKGSFRNDMELVSLDGGVAFTVFMRQSVRFPEDFSIGLTCKLKDTPRFNIFRCNGPHGDHRDIVPAHPHFRYHPHLVSAEDINDGIFVERHGTALDVYASYRDAVYYFLKHINLDDADKQKYFPRAELALPLFPDEDSE